MQIKVTNSDGYDWIEVDEIYQVISKSKNGYYIQVFGIEFHVLQEDCKPIFKNEGEIYNVKIK